MLETLRGAALAVAQSKIPSEPLYRNPNLVCATD